MLVASDSDMPVDECLDSEAVAQIAEPALPTLPEPQGASRRSCLARICLGDPVNGYSA